PGEINNAAAGLKQLGVKPLVVFLQTPHGSSNNLDLAYAAAANYGLGQGANQVDPNLLALVVVLSTRQSTVLYGDALKPVMEKAAGGATLADQIRTGYLNPNLASGNYTAAFAESLRFAATQIDLDRNPVPTATPAPSVIQNIDTKGLGNSLLICVGIGVVLGALAMFGPVLWRNRQNRKAAELRRRALQEQLVQARNVTADMITDLDYPVDPSEQIQYRFLALSLEKERPEQLAGITAQYRQIYDKVAAALAEFNTLNESKPATEQELSAAIARYQLVQTEIRNAGGFLQWLADQSRSVEAQVTSAPGDIDAAKKALAAATEQISRLAATAPELGLSGDAALLDPARAKVEHAEALLSQKPPLSLKARDTALAVRSEITAVTSSISALSASYEAVSQQRAQLMALGSKGFKLASIGNSLDEAVAALRQASSQFSHAEAFEATLKKAGQTAQQAGAQAKSLVALQTANQEALAKLSAEGEELKALIRQGAEAFDAVDEYAEDSWRDIRGNGTEAQRAADEAYNLWQEASQLNSLAPDSPQDFEAAAGLIAEAQECAARTRELIAAIVERLQHIKESQAAARDEIAAAERDIEAGAQYVSRFDPDISTGPVEDLSRARRILEEARAEIAQPKPDWIGAVKMARQANDTADKALASARTEHERLEALRLRASTTAQQAAASLSRAGNFVTVHKTDVPSDIASALSHAQALMDGTNKSLAEAQKRGVEDLTLAAALEKAASGYAEVVQAGDAAYQKAEAQFRAMEHLRLQAFDAVQRAEASVESATNYVNENSRAIRQETVDLLNQAISMVPAWRDGSNSSTLGATLQAAQNADELASGAMSAAVSDVNTYNRMVQNQQMQDMLGTVIALGAAASLAGGGRRRSRGGWGGGWGGGSWGGGSLSGGGGSSGGGWGGGGSSGGSWGGGGSSGGSWGGGGSSSGGW
ncbi:MAG TPA: hypothetical protein VM409_05025, partial [Chloroflexia bacterium]|nr:hypothetical protein [Chloroflexia bacterium]